MAIAKLEFLIKSDIGWSGGMITRRACGITIKRRVLSVGSPTARLASHCPLDTALMPARMISAIKAPGTLPARAAAQHIRASGSIRRVVETLAQRFADHHRRRRLPRQARPSLAKSKAEVAVAVGMFLRQRLPVGVEQRDRNIGQCRPPPRHFWLALLSRTMCRGRRAAAHKRWYPAAGAEFAQTESRRLPQR